MSEEFDPMQAVREPRSEGYKQETEQLVELLHKRGDQRIGQLIINAIRDTKIHKDIMDNGNSAKEATEMILWSLEAPELVEKIEKYVNKHE